MEGKVIALLPNHKMRLQPGLMGDFTPFHTAKVEFDHIALDGKELPLQTTGAVTGAPVLRLSAPGATRKKSLISREWSMAKTKMHDQIAYFTAPGFGDRAKQLLYHHSPTIRSRFPRIRLGRLTWPNP